MPQVESGGTAYVKVDGTQYDVEGNLKISMGGPTRTPKTALDGRVLGWTTKHTAPEVSMDISDSGGLSLKAMQSLNGETITFELGNGKVYTLESAFAVDKVELDTIEGKIPWKLSGLALMEQTA